VRAFRPNQMAGMPVTTPKRRLNNPRVSAFRARLSIEPGATCVSGSVSTPECGPGGRLRNGAVLGLPLGNMVTEGSLVDIGLV
jgi:hypothetical protein